MPKAGKYKWLSSLRVLVYNASVYPKSDIYTNIYLRSRLVGLEISNINATERAGPPSRAE